MSENNQQAPRTGAVGRRGPMGMRGGPAEKAKNFKGTWVKLIKYVRAYMPIIIIALLCAAGGTVFTVMGPDKLKDMIAEIYKIFTEGSISMNAVASIGLILIIFYVSSAILNLIQGFILATLSQKMAKRMRTDISNKINKLPMKYFDKVSYGDILSRASNDVDTIGQTMNQSIASLVTAVTMFVGLMIMMFITSWQMALVTIVSSFIGFFLISIIMVKSQKYFKAQQAELGTLNGHIEEMYTGHTVVQAYNGSKASKKTFEVTNSKLYTSAWKSQFMSGLMMPLMAFIGNLGFLAVCVTGAIIAVKDPSFFPVIGAFIVYARLFTQPLSNFAQATQNLQRTAAAGERVFEFLDEPELEDESHKQVIHSEKIRGDVEFRNVEFGYEENKLIIKNFSAKVKSGQKVAIVGPTGAGKTTIVNLLMRFFEVNSGQILIDGMPTSEMTRNSVHEKFCMVLQDSWLFEGTIKDNIKYACTEVSDDAVIEACHTVGLHHIIQTLPEGYDTVLNDKASLSEGEKQLLTIARAIIKNSPLLILDEATSSVDTRTEALVQKAMDKLMRGRTSFVIAHRLSTIKNADLILVMNDGDIVESGTHNELLKKDGFYAELYNSQFEQ